MDRHNQGDAGRTRPAEVPAHTPELRQRAPSFIENLRGRDTSTPTSICVGTARKGCCHGGGRRSSRPAYRAEATDSKRARAVIKGPRMERGREAVVAAVDERRLMVSQFYIESREHALRTPRKVPHHHRSRVRPDVRDRADTPAIVQGADAAAEAMYRIVKDHGRSRWWQRADAWSARGHPAHPESRGEGGARRLRSDPRLAGGPTLLRRQLGADLIWQMQFVHMILHT